MCIYICVCTYAYIHRAIYFACFETALQQQNKLSAEKGTHIFGLKTI